MSIANNNGYVTKARLKYLIATIILLFVEILIALFVHDRFIRPYVGDILVVIVIYAFIRIFVVKKVHLLPFYVWVFASSVEILQYFSLVERLGLSSNRFWRVLVGAVFDIKDIICYAVGCIVLGLYEMYLYTRNNKG